MHWADTVGLKTVAEALSRFAARDRRRQPGAGAAPEAARRRGRPLRRPEERLSRRRPIMTDAVIVSTARTPIGKAHRGALNLTRGADLAAHAIRGALDRAPSSNRRRSRRWCSAAAIRRTPRAATSPATPPCVAGIPVESAGVTVSRFCASGLEAIASAARRIILDGVPVAVRAASKSISLVQPKVQRELTRNAWLEAHLPAIYMPMIETADIVAERYGISREAQDRFALESQRRTAAAQASAAVRRRDRPDERRHGGDRQGHRRDAGRSRPGSPRTRATGRTRRSKVSPSSSPCAGRAPSSPRAMPASSRTGPRPAC